VTFLNCIFEAWIAQLMSWPLRAGWQQRRWLFLSSDRPCFPVPAYVYRLWGHFHLVLKHRKCGHRDTEILSRKPKECPVGNVLIQDSVSLVFEHNFKVLEGNGGKEIV
jgi:hypothetical protein